MMKLVLHEDTLVSEVARVVHFPKGKKGHLITYFTSAFLPPIKNVLNGDYA